MVEAAGLEPAQHWLIGVWEPGITAHVAPTRVLWLSLLTHRHGSSLQPCRLRSRGTATTLLYLPRLRYQRPLYGEPALNPVYWCLSPFQPCPHVVNDSPAFFH